MIKAKKAIKAGKERITERIKKENYSNIVNFSFPVFFMSSEIMFQFS